MSTRSLIGQTNDTENAGRYVYCHFDGYPEGNGAILQTCYNTDERVSALLEGGDMSSLAETLDKCTNREPTLRAFRIPPGNRYARRQNATDAPKPRSHWHGVFLHLPRKRLACCRAAMARQAHPARQMA